jgi:hypothetical protein
VSGEATTKDLWSKLGTLYRSKSLVEKKFLPKKVYKLRMKYGGLVIEKMNASNIMVTMFLSIDIKIFDYQQSYQLDENPPEFSSFKRSFSVARFKKWRYG